MKITIQPIEQTNAIELSKINLDYEELAFTRINN